MQLSTALTSTVIDEYAGDREYKDEKGGRIRRFSITEHEFFKKNKLFPISMHKKFKKDL